MSSPSHSVLSKITLYGAEIISLVITGNNEDGNGIDLLAERAHSLYCFMEVDTVRNIGNIKKSGSGGSSR